MEIIELTREQAVKEHRKMWNWIAEQLESGVESDISSLKSKYCKTIMAGVHLLYYCFCCEYAKNKGGCGLCPILWGSEEAIHHFYCEHDEYGNYNEGLWWKAQKESLDRNYKEASIIARQIANLPERPVEKTED